MISAYITRTVACMFLCAMLFSQSFSQSAPDSVLPLDRIFMKPYIAGTRPVSPILSTDGNYVIFSWDNNAQNNYRYWMVNSDGSRLRKLPVDSTVGELELSPDSRSVACTRSGDIFITDTSFTTFERMTKTHAWESGLKWSPNGRLLAFFSDRKLYVASVWKLALYEIAKPTSENTSIHMVDFFPSNKRVLFTETIEDGLKDFLVPRFTGKEVSTRSFKAGLGKTQIGIAPIDTGATIWVTLPGDSVFYLGGMTISPDGTKLLIERISADQHKREIFVADTDSGKAKLIYEETDKTWIESGLTMMKWMPGSREIIFTSEKDGWNHLYSISPEGKDLTQLTEGEWEIHWFDIEPKGNHIYCLANEFNHHQWLVYDIDLNTGSAQALSDTIGSYEDPILSKTSSFILARHSNFTQPTELVRINTHLNDSSAQVLVDEGTSLMIPIKPEVTQITHTIPEEFSKRHWITPEIISFKSSDGRTVPAMIYKPANFDPQKKYPTVVFVHGAGYLQNVEKGWSYYYREYMFHNRLTQLGYVVLEVEYRGSAGYGRQFRSDVYMHLGGKDLQDELEGLDYVTKLGYIDPAHVGIYGGSYGGFMSLMGLMLSDKYACGAALRAVTSWENYYRHNQWYTEARLGKPETNPDAYKISSPISFVDSLKKPVLLLHGMVDDNVFFQDAVQLIDKLQKGKKDFEVMVYPDEAHSFTQPESWFDEYKRIEEFFGKHLMNQGK